MVNIYNETLINTIFQIIGIERTTQLEVIVIILLFPLIMLVTDSILRFFLSVLFEPFRS